MACLEQAMGLARQAIDNAGNDAIAFLGADHAVDAVLGIRDIAQQRGIDITESLHTIQGLATERGNITAGANPPVNDAGAKFAGDDLQELRFQRLEFKMTLLMTFISPTLIGILAALAALLMRNGQGV